MIDRVKPDILWNDIGYPAKGNPEKVISYYYNNVPEGVINERWVQYGTFMKFTLLRPIRSFVNWLGAQFMKQGKTGAPSKLHHDFTTPEFTYLKTIQEKKYEAILSFGTSVAYNAQEREEDYISVTQMVHYFIDIISKNGNLLLIMSPRADGSIPEIQAKRFVEFGKWIKTNERAIYGTRPWKDQESFAEANGGMKFDVRFTADRDSLYAFLLGAPKADAGEIKIKNLTLKPGTKITLLSGGVPISWKQKDGCTELLLPSGLNTEHALAFRIFPKPE